MIIFSHIKNTSRKAGGYSSLVECLSSMCEAMGPMPSIAKQTKTPRNVNLYKETITLCSNLSLWHITSSTKNNL